VALKYFVNIVLLVLQHTYLLSFQSLYENSYCEY